MSKHSNAPRIHGFLGQALAGTAVLFGGQSAAMADVASACLNDDLDKVCLALVAAPDDILQPSLTGGDDTFVIYGATLTHIENQSTRFVDVSFALTAGASVRSIVSDQNGVCSSSGNQAQCLYDKLLVDGPVQIGLEVRLPDFAGAATPTEMVNSVEFGWNGRTSMVRSAIPMSASGYSYVPPNTRVTLVTAEQSTDPADQTNAENPLFAKMVVPPAAFPRLARLRITGQGPDISADCAAGIYFKPNGDGGPYICRDNDNPRRWVEAALEGEYPSDPIEFGLIWDTSIVPPTQLPPTPLTATGTPRFAVFYNAGDENSENRAFAQQCANTTEPCLRDVTAFGNGDWSATLLKATLADPGSAGPEPLSSQLLELVMPDGGIGIQGFIPSTPPVGNIR